MPLRGPGRLRLEALEERTLLSVAAQLKDINPGLPSSNPGTGAKIVNVSGFAVFPATNGTDGVELWLSDGTPGVTEQIKNINPTGDSSPSDITLANFVYFTADDGVHGRELWITDGTPAGNLLVKDINPTGSSNPTGLVEVNGLLYFSADNGTNGRELWVSDGTEAGTMMS